MLKDEEIKENLTRLILDNAFGKVEFEYSQDLFIDLDFDSLAYSALIVDVETFFGIGITTEDIEIGLRKPSDILKLVIEKLSSE